MHAAMKRPFIFLLSHKRNQNCKQKIRNCSLNKISKLENQPRTVLEYFLGKLIDIWNNIRTHTQNELLQDKDENI